MDRNMDSIADLLRKFDIYSKPAERALLRHFEEKFYVSNSEIYRLKSENSTMRSKLEDLTERLEDRPANKSGQYSSINYKGKKLHELTRSEMVEAIEFCFGRINALSKEKAELQEFYDHLMKDEQCQ